MAAPASATIVFSDGFEAPTHTAGLGPSNGWNQGGSQVSSLAARTGSQSLTGLLNPSLGFVQVLATARLSGPMEDVLEYSAYSMSTLGATTLVGFQFGNGNAGRLLRFGYATSIGSYLWELTDLSFNVVTSGSGTTTGIQNGEWGQLKLTLDTTTDTVAMGINGSTVASLANLSSYASQPLYGLNLSGNTVGNPITSRLYFDDVEVDTYDVVPEPATMTAMGLALVAMARRRRR